MKSVLQAAGSLLVIAPIISNLAFAQIEKRQVSFPAGKTSTTIKSSIKGEKTIDYQLSAKEGQTLYVTLTTNNSSNYFNVLPPGSTDVANFVGSSEGNTYQGTLSQTGTWTIRVYLMRNAARRNESASYSLKVGVTNGASSNSTDALVPGTKYNATGTVKAYQGNTTTAVDADFGVIRKGNGNAEIHLKIPNGLTQKIQFVNNKWSSLDGSSIKATRINSDEWRVTVDDYTSYIIFNAIIYGG